MLTHEALNERLLALEGRMPAMLRDRNAFFRKFEDETEILMAEAEPDDQEFLLGALLQMCQRHGVTPQDIKP